MSRVSVALLLASGASTTRIPVRIVPTVTPSSTQNALDVPVRTALETSATRDDDVELLPSRPDTAGATPGQAFCEQNRARFRQALAK